MSLVGVQHVELCWVTVSPDNASPYSLTGFPDRDRTQSPEVWTFPPHCPSVLITSRLQWLDRHQSVSVDAVVLTLTTGAFPRPLLITRQRRPAETAQRGGQGRQITSGTGWTRLSSPHSDFGMWSLEGKSSYESLFSLVLFNVDEICLHHMTFSKRLHVFDRISSSSGLSGPKLF